MKAVDLAKTIVDKIAAGDMSPGEPVFCLRARDLDGPRAVLQWCELALERGVPAEKIREAITCAEDMARFPIWQVAGRDETRKYEQREDRRPGRDGAAFQVANLRARVVERERREDPGHRRQNVDELFPQMQQTIMGLLEHSPRGYVDIVSPLHGDLRVSQEDGDQICCTRTDAENLQEARAAGFGKTLRAAADSLVRQETKLAGQQEDPPAAETPEPQNCGDSCAAPAVSPTVEACLDDVIDAIMDIPENIPALCLVLPWGPLSIERHGETIQVSRPGKPETFGRGANLREAADNLTRHEQHLEERSKALGKTVDAVERTRSYIRQTCFEIFGTRQVPGPEEREIVQEIQEQASGPDPAPVVRVPVRDGNTVQDPSVNVDGNVPGPGEPETIPWVYTGMTNGIHYWKQPGRDRHACTLGPVWGNQITGIGLSGMSAHRNLLDELAREKARSSSPGR